MKHLSMPGSGSLDEIDARARLAEAVDDLRRVDASERPRVRQRIEGLSTQLARVLTRTGREHLATLLVADDVPSDA